MAGLCLAAEWSIGNSELGYLARNLDRYGNLRPNGRVDVDLASDGADRDDESVADRCWGLTERKTVLRE